MSQLSSSEINIALLSLGLTKPPGEGLLHWLTKTLFWEVGAAVLLEAIIGYVAGRLD